MNVNLKLMHTFLLVAEHSSFCRAAEVSNRSQSAVSMQIKQLEEQVGVALFHRTTRRVELTAEGLDALRTRRTITLTKPVAIAEKKARGAYSGGAAVDPCGVAEARVQPFVSRRARA